MRNFFSNGTLAGAWLIQARRFASRSSTRQTTHLNSDKKVNSKPSETWRSPLNRLANRHVILRTAAYFEFLCLFFLPSVFGCVFFRAAFSLRSPFLIPLKPFFFLFEYDFTPWKRQKSTQNLFQPIHAFLSAYDIIVDVTTTSHFGTFRSHRCSCICQLPVV